MTSFPVSRDVAGVATWWFLLVVLRSVQPAGGCILLLDGWSPMSAAERASLADIVAVGVVRRAFKSARRGDAAATYSAEVRLFDVFKGRRLVDSVPDRPEVRRSTSGGQTVGATRTPVIDSSGVRARISTLLKHSASVFKCDCQLSTLRPLRDVF